MKSALLTDGRSILASPTSPSKAFCPICGDTVILRQRRLMNNQAPSYFWRHQRNRNRDCSARKQSSQFVFRRINRQ